MSPERLGERGLAALGLPGAGHGAVRAAVRTRVRSPEPDLTVVNGATAPTVELLDALDPSGPVVTVAHELSTGWMSNLDCRARRLLLERSSSFLAVSESVRRFLVEQLGVPRSATHVVPPPVGSSSMPERDRDPSLVAGMGVTDWRKAPESWLRVAALLRRHPDLDHVRFVWAGGDRLGSRSMWPLEHEMGRLDLRESVTFLGSVSDPWQSLSAASVMVSTAREDAYPLSCAEAIARGIPVVGFDVDGVGEMVRDSGCGAVVRYPDEGALADEVVLALTDPGLWSSRAERGRDWARKLAPGTVAGAVAEWTMEQIP